MKTTLAVFCCIVAVTTQVHGNWLGDLISPSEPKEIKSTQGRFSVKSSVALTETVVTKETVLPDGTSVKMDVHMFQGSDRGSAYSVCYNDFPDWIFKLTDGETLLNSAATGLQVLNNGQLLLHSRISIGGYPGREALVESQTKGQKYSIKARYYMVGTRLYQIMVVVPKGRGDISETAAFLESFLLLGK